MDDDKYYDGLGASMCAAILGEDKNCSPYDLWRRFVDPSARENLDDNEAVQAGIALEPAIAHWAAKRLGITIDYKPGALIQHPSLPFMRIHPDAMVVGEEAGLEVKNRGLQTARVYADLADFQEDSDRAQATEVLQCHASITVRRAKHWYLGVAVGGQKLLTFKIERDEEMCAAIEQRYTEFWGYVERREPPPPINVSDCNRLWPKQEAGKVIEATPEIAELVAKRAQLKAQKKSAETDLEFLDFQIRRFMQDAEELRAGGKKLLTWKWQKRPGYTVADNEMRVMR